MRIIVRARREEGLVGRDQRQAKAVGEPYQRRLDRPLGLEAVALDLDIEAAVERAGETPQAALGEIGHMEAERAVDRPGRAAGQRDQAFRADKPGEGDMRLVSVRRIEPEAGDEPHQAAVSGLVLGEEHDRRPRHPLLGEARGRGRGVAEVDRHLSADDRLDAGLGELFRELEGAEEIVGVRDRQRRHAVGLGELGQGLDRERALTQREGAMHMQMHEADGFDEG